MTQHESEFWVLRRVHKRNHEHTNTHTLLLFTVIQDPNTHHPRKFSGALFLLQLPLSKVMFTETCLISSVLLPLLLVTANVGFIAGSTEVVLSEWRTQ